MSEISDKQKLFFRLFIQWSNIVLAKGYEFTWGEAFRTDEQAEINAMGPTARLELVNFIKNFFSRLADAIKNNGRIKGIRVSAHGKRLAIDLNAFKDGKYLIHTEDWKEIGEIWESLHPDCRWGGRFGDGNHLSMEFEGVK